VIELNAWDLATAATLVMALAVTSFYLQLGIGKSLIVSAIRTTVQLLLIGMVLKILFDNANVVFIAVIAIIMLSVASREVFARQQRRFTGWWSFGIGSTSMFISTFSITLLTLWVIIASDPWYSPQYAIPLLGMLLGNSMNGVSLSLDRLTQAAWQQRDIIEQRLMLGLPRHEAFLEVRKESIRAGMIPIINAMTTAGLVNLPGMMTGQIIAGSPPVEAVKYQILIMFLIATSTGFGIIAAVALATRRLFDERHRLRLDTLTSKSKP
jgi:putative ABC transport system permease protein